MLPNSSTSTSHPGGTTVVVSYCSMAGPLIRSPRPAWPARSAALQRPCRCPVDLERHLARELQDSRLVVVAGGIFGPLQLVDQADGDDADVDDLDFGVESVAVLGLVRVVEGGSESLPPSASSISPAGTSKRTS